MDSFPNGANSSNPEKTAKSQTELETISTCRDLELHLVQANTVFENTIAYAGVAKGSEAGEFFAELKPLSDGLLEASFGESQIDEGMRNVANVVAGDVASVQGLISESFDPFIVGDTLRPSIEALLLECSKWVTVSTSADTLFVAPQRIEFELKLTEPVSDDPLLELVRKTGLSCDSSAGPELRQDSPTPFIQAFCGGSDGYFLIRRHSSNLDALAAARELAATADWRVVVYSDQFSGMVWKLTDLADDPEGSKTLAFSVASATGLKVLSGE